MDTPEKEFIRYTDPYRVYGDKAVMKIDHTLRVRKLSEDIAESLFLPAEDIRLAAVCGLLHDIGRFEQWRQYGTYNDSKSVDHGDLGAAVLCENNLIAGFAETDHEVILNAVIYHNKYALPETLNERERLFVNIVRDADKIDILRMYADGTLISRTHGTAVSPAVYRSLLRQVNIRSCDICTKADAAALHLSFIYGLNFRRSFILLKQDECLNQFIDRAAEEAESEELKAQLEELRPLISGYISRKAEDL